MRTKKETEADREERCVGVFCTFMAIVIIYLILDLIYRSTDSSMFFPSMLLNDINYHRNELINNCLQQISQEMIRKGIRCITKNYQGYSIEMLYGVLERFKTYSTRIDVYEGYVNPSTFEIRLEINTVNGFNCSSMIHN